MEANMNIDITLPLNIDEPFDNFEYEFFNYLFERKINMFKIPKYERDNFINYYYNKNKIVFDLKKININKTNRIDKYNKDWINKLNHLKYLLDNNLVVPKKLSKWRTEQKYRLNCNKHPDRKNLWNKFCKKYD